MLSLRPPDNEALRIPIPPDFADGEEGVAVSVRYMSTSRLLEIEQEIIDGFSETVVVERYTGKPGADSSEVEIERVHRSDYDQTRVVHDRQVAQLLEMIQDLEGFDLVWAELADAEKRDAVVTLMHRWPRMVGYILVAIAKWSASPLAPSELSESSRSDTPSTPEDAAHATKSEDETQEIPARGVGNGAEITPASDIGVG